MKIVNIRDVCIGTGQPKICVPLIAKSVPELKKEADYAVEGGAELIELRIDYFVKENGLHNIDEAIVAVRKQIGELPLLMTFRTKEEGGVCAISPAEYERLLLRAAAMDAVDLIDVELNLGEAFVKALTKKIKEKNTCVIISNHDFEKTASKEALIARFEKMEQLGADIAKIAMMPTCERDVLVMLEATLEMKEKSFPLPIISMSMGRYGAVSRLCGEVFGSAVTFAAAGEASAPGQMKVTYVRQMLALLRLS